MKYNRSRDGIVIALSLLQAGDKTSAVRAFKMLKAGEEVQEVVEELEESSAKAYQATARLARLQARRNGVKANVKSNRAAKALATLNKVLAGDDLEVDEDEEDDDAMAAVENHTYEDDLPGAPDDTVHAGDDSDEDDEGGFNFDDEDEDDEEEARVAKAKTLASKAKVSLDRANRNLLIANAIRSRSTNR